MNNNTNRTKYSNNNDNYKNGSSGCQMGKWESPDQVDLETVWRSLTLLLLMMRCCTRTHPDSRAALAFCGAPGHSGSRGNRCTQLDRNGQYTVAHRGRQHTRHNLQWGISPVWTQGESHIHLQCLSVFSFQNVRQRRLPRSFNTQCGWNKRRLSQVH